LKVLSKFGLFSGHFQLSIANEDKMSNHRLSLLPAEVVGVCLRPISLFSSLHFLVRQC